MAKKKKKGTIKDIMGLTKGVMVTGLGAGVIAKAGYDAAPLSRLSRFYPTVGKAMGTGILLKHLKGIGG